ncbi:MAG: N-acetylmuramoyl-L-alanine amidase [Melioribacteraceae bacterium]|nr:N-acetylmuramoyl-L-alanine amidase [Melioribacteraceae bacterium]
MKIKILLFLLILTFINIPGQRLLKYSVSVGEKTERLSYLSRKGIDYVSAKGLSAILSGNYYYSKETAKIELKFLNYNIKFTARNQFVIIVDKKTNDKKVYQIPVSTLLLKDDVFIPIKFCIKYVSFAFENTIAIDKDSKHLAVTHEKTENLMPHNGTAIQNDTQKPIEILKPTNSSEFDVYGMNLNELANGTLINLYSKTKLNKVSKPAILNGVLHFNVSGVTIDPDIGKKFKPTGFIKTFKLKKLSWQNYQLEYKLKSGYSKVAKSYDEEGGLQISIHSKIYEKEDVDYEAEKKKWKLDVVVIDPGHGGKDPGAIGKRGTKEKDLNLKLGLKLGKLIKDHFGDKIKIEYTRENDKFVELFKRGKIANEKDGKLFISIHCNSNRSRSPRGFEVYLLRPGKTKEAIEIAEFENSVISMEDNPDRYKELTDDNFILVSMAHSSFMRYSEKFSEKMVVELDKIVNIPSRGIKQAGFYVLVGASMPGILFEAGFLSNKLDEAYLKSSAGQDEIAKGMLNAVIGYKDYYDKMIKNGN